MKVCGFIQLDLFSFRFVDLFNLLRQVTRGLWWSGARTMARRGWRLRKSGTAMARSSVLLSSSARFPSLFLDLGLCFLYCFEPSSFCFFNGSLVSLASF